MALDKTDYITVAQLGSGWAAVHMRYDAEIDDYDVQQTGIGRYATPAGAEIEAHGWSQADEIKLKLPENPWD